MTIGMATGMAGGSAATVRLGRRDDAIAARARSQGPRSLIRGWVGMSEFRW
jgi:hypothetical protein